MELDLVNESGNGWAGFVEGDVVNVVCWYFINGLLDYYGEPNLNFARYTFGLIEYRPDFRDFGVAFKRAD